MAYLASQLVSEAWYLSGIVARGLETPGGDEMTDGLRLLNLLLTDKSITARLIPYYSQVVVNCVVGQESYSVPGLIVAEEVTYVLDGVRFPMVNLGRRAYFASGRVNSIQALPYSYHIERGLGGATLWVYFLPNQAYPITITGKFALTQVTTDTDLLLALDMFYINYLQYSLANRMCQFYDVALHPDSANELKNYENQIIDLSPMDLTIVKSSTLTNRGTLNWAQVNLGKGWTV